MTYMQTGQDLAVRRHQLLKSKSNDLSRPHDSQSGLYICYCHIPNIDYAFTDELNSLYSGMERH